MIKTVNVYARHSAYIDGINFSGPAHNLELDTETIRKCLLEHILVEEVLDDGTTVALGFDNFDKDLDGDDDVKFLDDDEEELPKFKIFSVDQEGNKGAVETGSKSTIEKIVEAKKEETPAPVKPEVEKVTPGVPELKEEPKEELPKVVEEPKKTFKRK